MINEDDPAFSPWLEGIPPAHVTATSRILPAVTLTFAPPARGRGTMLTIEAAAELDRIRRDAGC
ncbi:MAG: hypothetical protein PHT60_15000 [Acidiphilium sp.]|nr:hypothetical protein [Acidiphilium sp.]MDD4937070.1 hypothetical protein [Acidiphilium sp.]